MPPSNLGKNLDIAYFSMEIMLESDIPTYAGGLGILAGDILRSCADLNISSVGVTLIYSGNTFSQFINLDGSQSFKEVDWQKQDHLKKLPQKIKLQIQNTEVIVGCWRYDIVGQDGSIIPVFLLDTDLPENPQWARDLTKALYSGDRFGQEIVLGIGGVKLLRALGYKNIQTYHLNEGHSALVTLALLEELDYKDEEVKKKCVFTTHTPIPEGHDKFEYDLAQKEAAKYLPWHIRKIASEENLSMTQLALNLSKVSFAVSKKHQKVTENLFPMFKIDSITNGVHHLTWISPLLQSLYDQCLPSWREDPTILKMATSSLPNDILWSTHQECKKELISYVNKHLTSTSYLNEKTQDSELFGQDTLTIALARRPVPYKRPLLLYSDLERLIRIGVGKIQIIQCGKAHPQDFVAQSFIQQIIKISKKLRSIIRVCYLENYSPRIARLLVQGSDIWLNTPQRPLEASGTSGMKAALNGVLNFSILDGWWIEGFEMNPFAGFSIGPKDDSLTPINSDQEDAKDLYDKLETQIIPMYYDKKTEWINRMKNAITLGAYFNTHRVVKEYQEKGWDLKF